MIAHDIRSAHNVGSMMRTAEGLGISKMFITGYSPYPLTPDDDRLPHLASKVSARIHKASLGAEDSLEWSHSQDVRRVIEKLKSEGFAIAALEQSELSVGIDTYKAPWKIALIVGSEISGVSEEVLRQCDEIVEIPMSGRKESFNVSVAAGMALFHIVHG